MDEARVRAVAEVQRREVDEVEQQHHLGPGEVRMHEQPHETRVQQVVDDEVAAHRARRVDVLELAGEEVPDVDGLEDEEADPMRANCCLAGLGGKLSCR